MAKLRWQLVVAVLYANVTTVQGGPLAPTTPVPAVPTYSICNTSVVPASSSPQEIVSPNYPRLYENFLNCFVVIGAPEGEKIFLNLVDSAIESSVDCSNDGLVISEAMLTGRSLSSTQLGLFCGEDLTENFISDGSMLTLAFYTDRSISNRGFKVKFVSASPMFPRCFDSNSNITYLEATTSIQYLTSPHFPNNYNLNEDLHWIIYNMNGFGDIRINVVDSMIEDSIGCVNDRVTVYEGPCDSFPKLGTFCGEEKPTYYQRDGTYVLLTFTSDNNLTFRGFVISYMVTVFSSAPDTGSSSVSEARDYGELIAAIFSSIGGIIAIFGTYRGCKSRCANKGKNQQKESKKETTRRKNTKRSKKRAAYTKNESERNQKEQKRTKKTSKDNKEEPQPSVLERVMNDPKPTKREPRRARKVPKRAKVVPAHSRDVPEHVMKRQKKHTSIWNLDASYVFSSST